MRAAVGRLFGPNAARALAYYGLDQPGDGKSDPLYGPANMQIGADGLQRCGSVGEAILHAASSAPVYHYQFDRTIPGRPRPQHAGELPYVFGNLSPAVAPFGPVDRRILAEIQTYWLNFVRTGDPNGAGAPAWPRFDANRRAFMEFTDDGPVVKAGLRREICDLYLENITAQMAATGR
jgi:para-nitrobenzyl esterase